MNKFKVNLHPAFFDESSEKPTEAVSESDAVIRQTQEDLSQHRSEILATQLNQNNEALWSSETTETISEDKNLSKELKHLLKQLAKNKSVDFAWTDNEWKCSRAEKRLAVSSAKVFMQLIEVDSEYSGNKVEKILNTFRELSGKWTLEIDDAVANSIKNDLHINSKVKDIKNFYKSFVEYQSRQSGFIHLQGLMWFFFENGIDSRAKLQTSMEHRSQKIDKKDVRERWKQYKEQWHEDWRERAKFDIIKERSASKTDATEKMLLLMCDFNLDGEVNTWDVGYKTWSQFAEVFKREVELSKLRGWSADTPVQNLAAYATKMWLDMAWVTNAETLYTWMTWEKWYENTRRLQSFIQNSPADFSDILINWASAWQATMQAMMRAESLRASQTTEASRETASVATEQTIDNTVTIQTQWDATEVTVDVEARTEAVQKALDDKVKEILAREQEKIEALYPDKEQSSNIMQQLTNSLATTLFDNAVNLRKWMAAWAAVPLDQVIKWMTAGVNIWLTEDWEPVCWLFVGWNGSVDLGKWTDLSLWATAGTNFFIPFAALSAEVGKDIKEGRRNASLDAMWVGRISLGWNITVCPWLFSWWVSAWYENNKKKWIEKQAENIHNVIENNAEKWIRELPSADYQTRRAALREILAEEFKKTKTSSSIEDELDKASNNLMRILESFPMDPTSEDIKTYAKVVADVFTDMWRNSAIIGITDNKWKISWWKVWVQFLAGFFPTVTLVAKFTRYRNARTVETENSRIRRIDAAVNGTWNVNVTLENGEFGQKEVDSLNGVLARYGIKEGLTYVPWTDWQQPRIKVPQSVWKLIDVRVSSDLKGYIQYAAEKWPNGEIYYLFPTNTTYRFLTETGWNQKSAILNIGSDQNKESDIRITDTENMNGLAWDEELTDGLQFPENWEYVGQSVEYVQAPVLNELFNDADVVNALKTIDSADWKAFSRFMKTKKDANDDFNWQVDALVKVLSKNPKLKAISDALKDADKSNEEKQLIIDRVLAISANANVQSKKILDDLIKQRKEFYRKESMRWPNGRYIFSSLDSKYRAELQSEFTDADCKPQIMPNIVWATAFYNRHNTEKWLALTWLGVTSVLGWKTKVLEGTDAQQVMSWFLWGMDGETHISWALDKDKSPVERSNLKQSVINYIKGKGINADSLSDNQLNNLLRWDPVDLPLDNWQEMVKLKLDTKCVFYLMWECANESVWLQLWDIQVLRQVPRRQSGRLVLNGVDGGSRVDNTQSNVAVGVTLAGWERSTDTEERPNMEVWSDNYNNGLNNPGEPGTTPWQTSWTTWSDSYNNGLNNPGETVTPWWETPPASDF